MSVDEVKDSLPYAIAADEAKTGGSEDYEFYKSKSEVVLDEQPGLASFEFQNGKLSIVRFDFEVAENHQKWFDAQVEKLTKIYGTENDKKETEEDNLKTASYTWESENTILQAMLVIGPSSGTPIITIGVFTK